MHVTQTAKYNKYNSVLRKQNSQKTEVSLVPALEILFFLRSGSGNLNSISSAMAYAAEARTDGLVNPTTPTPTRVPPVKIAATFHSDFRSRFGLAELCK